MHISKGIWVERINAAFEPDNGRQGVVLEVRDGRAQVNWQYRYRKPLTGRIRNTRVRLQDLKIIEPIVERYTPTPDYGIEKAKQAAMDRHDAERDAAIADIGSQEG